MEHLAQNYADIKAQIARAAQLAKRAAGDIELLAISKTIAPPAIAALIGLGHRVFGENRVQEAIEKFTPLREAHRDLRVHMVGALQSNKAGLAVEFFDTIHSLDRPRLARALAEAAARHGRLPHLFIQLNFGNEAQKAGLAPAQLGDFLRQCTRDYQLPIKGLMCIPPHAMPPAPYFAHTARLAAEYGLSSLSMGMSNDFEAAVMLGATHIRIGTALFGARG